MADIFISYKSDERAVAEKVAQRLKDAGYDVWWDEHLYVAEQFGAKIKAELKAAKAVVILWSRASVKSVWVQSEAQDALRRQIAVGVITDDLLHEELPIPFDQIQAASLRGWNGRADDPGFRLILSSIDRLIRTPNVPAKGGQNSTDASAPAPRRPKKIDRRYWYSAAIALVVAAVGLFLLQRPDQQCSEKWLDRDAYSDCFEKMKEDFVPYVVEGRRSWFGAGDNEFRAGWIPESPVPECWESRSALNRTQFSGRNSEMVAAGFIPVTVRRFFAANNTELFQATWLKERDSTANPCSYPEYTPPAL
ncbi:toll/interleukin-1 receptor domain-containing protein [Devosia sp. Root413D1]|uniref:toll/interleukin-1 receptor domain-containing protein n=1 Tax=Devosia sp. Root413D1 TaxID=1736531 RepID=UPI000AC0D938|nr:toll/interleukin-1 receptor domain-containing protein [Devosia sp. Root413D1]